MDPFLLGVVLLRVAPIGPIHVLFTLTLLSTDGSNWILQIRVMLLPIAITWLRATAVMFMIG